ncbi:MAG TPA: DUF3618 domain-containing protein [Mycobacteriales bacterium]|nr:DUF3618 domain-containing protein [Mycobacteriales bacterium]
MPTTRKPEVIVREIEQTRAELADTIDAITGRINPRRAASRGARAVRDQVAAVRDRVEDATSGDSSEGPKPYAAALPLAEHKPRPAVLLGAAAVVMLGLVLIRRRR